MRERAAISYFFQLHPNLCLCDRRGKTASPINCFGNKCLVKKKQLSRPNSSYKKLTRNHLSLQGKMLCWPRLVGSTEADTKKTINQGDVFHTFIQNNRSKLEQTLFDLKSD